MLTFDGVSRAFGTVHALSDISFQARSGQVTGLLGPNGSGKTTALRILVALERADAGRALIDGTTFAELESPMASAAALLDARAAHPGRKAIDHLRALALTHGIGMDRVYDVLELAGLEYVGHRRIGTYSLGMRQRLGIAALLLGDPTNIVLDEPVNGLDPDGVLWLRSQLRTWADEGRTVLLSSHLISELALTVDHVVILGRGRVLADAALEDLEAGDAAERVTATSPRAGDLAGLLGSTAIVSGSRLTVTGMTASHVGETAASAGIPLSHLATERPSLEAIYRHLTDGQRDHEARRT